MTDEKIESRGRGDLVKIINALSKVLNEKEKRVIAGRFGLSGRKETLSAIGRELHLSRERIRQIEKNSLRKLSNAFMKNYQDVTSKILEAFENLGGVIVDDEIPEVFLRLAGDHKFARNYLRLAFSIISRIEKIDESADLKNGWILKNVSKPGILSICKKMIGYFEKEKLPQNISDLKKEIDSLTKLDEKFLAGCVAISAEIITAKNGMIGLKRWPSVNPRNVRDKIYYVLKNAGKPLHFVEITAAIAESRFDQKKVVRATVHNELIADRRFVLIGRGIYALREWGYSDGTVYEVIKNILSNAKSPMPVSEIIELVSKSRKVKRNTIVINLQTKKEFKRVGSGYIYQKL